MTDYKINKKVNDFYNNLMQNGVPINFYKTLEQESQKEEKLEEKDKTARIDKSTVVRREEKKHKSIVPGFGTIF